MWVYHLGREEESQQFVAEIEIQKGVFRSFYSGPVFSLLLPQIKVICMISISKFAIRHRKFSLKKTKLIGLEFLDGIPNLD